MYFLLVRCEQMATMKVSWERLHCLKRDAYTKIVSQNSTGLGLCMRFGMSIELLSPDTENGRVKEWKETILMMLLG